MRVLFIAVLLLMLSNPVHAQESSAVSAEAGATFTASGDTRIELDEQAGVIRFFIDGQQRAFLDADGLHVRDALDYGGVLVDVGKAAFDRRAVESRGGPHAQ